MTILYDVRCEDCDLLLVDARPYAEAKDEQTLHERNFGHPNVTVSETVE